MSTLETTARRATGRNRQARPAHARYGRRARRWQLALLILMLPFFVAPFYVMITAAFKTSQQADVLTMWQLPNPVSFDGIRDAWSKLSPNFLNSVVMVVPATVLSSLIGSFNGYLLSKFTFRLSNVMFTLMLVGMFIPYQSILSRSRRRSSRPPRSTAPASSAPTGRSCSRCRFPASSSQASSSSRTSGTTSSSASW